jgi:hypothetical protein
MKDFPLHIRIKDASAPVKNNQTEAKLQRAFCSWMGMQYPDVYFSSDASSLGAGWSTIKNIQATKSNHAHLDVTLLQPAKQYHALILEFKKESPYLQDGTLSKEIHIREQLKTMELLRKLNYKCEWVWDLDQAIQIATEYLGQPEEDNSPLFP